MVERLFLKPKRKGSPRYSKVKGRKAQGWFRDQLLACFPQLTRDDIRSTPMGSSGEDIQLSPAARLLIPFTIESKSYARIVVYKWLEQRKGPHHPLVVAKANNKRPIVILYADDFLALLTRGR